MWYVKDDSKLGMLDTDQKYRLEHTLERTAVSRKLLAFQVRFVSIADSLYFLCTMTSGSTQKKITSQTD